MKKIALVTGASYGIGEALSRELIRQGWVVAGAARSQSKLASLQQELGNAFLPLVCDVSESNSINRVSKQLMEQNLYPSLFFLNAGIAGEQAVENPTCFDLAIHERIMRVNYFGVLGWVQFWEKPCQANGGANFIVTSSVNAIFAPPTGSAYAASKAAIAKAFEGLALTYFGTNLNFSVIYPGPVATAGLKGKVPFIWKPEKMAAYMIRCALKKKAHGEPSFFYSIVTRLFRSLPHSWTMSILKKLS